MIVVVFIFVAFVFIVLNRPVFGSLPKGDRLKKIRNAGNYNKNSLHNLSFTPMKPEGVSYWDMIKGMLKKNENKRPKKPMPSIKPNFTFNGKSTITWFGHSSYLIQIEGKNILVDPVFSERTSPFTFLGSKNFEGTDIVKPEDFPELDVVLITHDHYDHLDYPTILKLKDKTKLFITAIGVGAHLEYWDIPSEKIIELSWGEEAFPLPNFKFTATPARHFTGRRFKRNQTLWSSFVLETANCKLFLGGDSGYDTHFKEIGDQYGPFDLAILECGQYNAYWPYIHMFPEETVKATQDLQAKVLLPVHWGKFTLAMHSWDDSVNRVVMQAKLDRVQITTPMLGERILLAEHYPNTTWWLS